MKLIILSAPSGAGKTTLCSRLLQEIPKIRLSVSTTTRNPRGQEIPGTHYHFVSKEIFQRGIDAHAFAEWAHVHGNFYGTSKAVLEENERDGFATLLDIDVQGAKSLHALYGRSTLRLFVAPPSLSELESRLRARKTDSEDQIRLRLINAQKELEAAKDFERVIINDDLERAYQELSTIVRWFVDG
jgi:guanylate kinase